MCNEKDAARLIKEAIGLEKTDSLASRKKYLEAAQIFLLCSVAYKDEKQLWLDRANALFKKANAMKNKEPLFLGGDTVFQPENVIEKTKITFRDIGGLANLKEDIRFKIIEPMKNPKVFSYYGKKIGGGILMYGPPGCGKSLIAEATANEAGCAFFHVKASDIRSKYAGEAEKNIAELFKKAREKQPAVIFFDEFESLGGDRSEALSHERSAIAQLLTEMDGMGTKGQKILLLAATNEPWSIDPALRREGRFGGTIFVPAPDFKARKEILKIKLNKRPISINIDVNELAKITEGFSGADLAGLVEAASEIPLKEYFKTKNLRKINHNDFMKAKQKVRSVIADWYNKAVYQLNKRNMAESFEELVVEANPYLKKKVTI